VAIRRYGSQRWCQIGVVASSLALTTGMLTACTFSGSTAMSPPTGAAPAIGPGPTATLPTGTREAVHVTAVAVSMNESNDLLWGADRQVGPAYDLAVAKEPSRAVISFKVDPARLAAAVGVPGASPAGLYIQIFEPSLDSWIPLASKYHPSSRTVTAMAPHLSVVSLAWTAVGCVVTCPAAIVAKVAKRFTADIVTNIKEAFPPKQNRDQCAARADKRWSVQSSIERLSGCVIDSAGAPEVQVENPMLLPMTIRQPRGAPPASLSQQPYLTGAHPELSSLVTGVIDWTSGATLIAPRDFGVLPLQDLSGVDQLPMATQPDALALVMDVIQGVLSALPGEKTEDEEIDDAIKAVLPQFEEKIAQDPRSVSLTDILNAVEDNMAKQEAAATGPALTFVRTLSDGYTCATDEIGSVTDGEQDNGTADRVLNAAIGVAKKCTTKALEEVGKETDHSFKDALDIIDGVPDFIDAIREGIQFAELGPSSILATTIVERAAEAQAPSAGEDVSVIPCDARAVPRSVALPSPVALPSGAAVYGTTQPGMSSLTLSIAPAGFTCSALEGGDGSFVISFTAPGTSAAAISYGYSAGGAMINLESVCGYFPRLKAEDAMIRGGQGNCFPHPSGEIARPVATGDPRVLAATILDPPGTLSADADPSHGQEESVGVVVASDGGGQEAGCVLPSDQRQICIAGLNLFVDQSLVARDGTTPLTAIQSAVDGL
jgi:hypothetical protein